MDKGPSNGSCHYDTKLGVTLMMSKGTTLRQMVRLRIAWKLGVTIRS